VRIAAGASRRRSLCRILKYACVGVTITVTIVIGLSLTWHVYYVGDKFAVGWWAGGLEYLNWKSKPKFQQEGLEQMLYPMGFRVDRIVLKDRYGGLLMRLPRWSPVKVELPNWLLFATTTMPTAFFFWLDRRRTRPGHCQQCGYNLTGNTSGICPECGTPIPKEMQEQLITAPPKR